MKIVDTHCHLYSEPLRRDPAGVLSRARAAGVSDVIVPAYDHASWPETEALALHEGVHAAIGLHPWVADEPLDPDLLRASLLRSEAVAIGEIGLDTKIEKPSREAQTRVLRAQIDLARDFDLPVILHIRGDFEEMIRILSDSGPGLRGVVHAFSRGPDLAARFIDLGFHVAYGGAVTRDGSRARTSAAVVPLDRILLETDAPSIGLDGVPAEETEPRHTRDVAAALTAIRGMTIDAIAEVTTANARNLFRF